MNNLSFVENEERFNKYKVSYYAGEKVDESMSKEKLLEIINFLSIEMIDYKKKFETSFSKLSIESKIDVNIKCREKTK